MDTDTVEPSAVVTPRVEPLIEAIVPLVPRPTPWRPWAPLAGRWPGAAVDVGLLASGVPLAAVFEGVVFAAFADGLPHAASAALPATIPTIMPRLILRCGLGSVSGSVTGAWSSTGPLRLVKLVLMASFLRLVAERLLLSPFTPLDRERNVSTARRLNDR